LRMRQARRTRPDLARRIALAPLGRGRGEGPARPENGRTHDARRLLLWFFTLLMSLAGSRPGGRPPFLLVQERRQRTRPQVCDPNACATGQTWVGALAGCAAELTARLRRSVQTTAASQTTMRGRCDAHAHPASTPPQAQPQGGEQPDTGHRCAWPGRRRAPHEAERSDGPYRSPSLLAVPRSAGRGAGWRRRTPAFVN
jgi:hypothetical protein